MWEHKPDLTLLPLLQPLNFGETSVDEYEVVRIVETKGKLPQGARFFSRGGRKFPKFQPSPACTKHEPRNAIF